MNQFIKKLQLRILKIYEDRDWNQFHYPRKVSASELLKLNWSTFSNPMEEVLQRNQNIYGRFNFVLPYENKSVVKYQKGHIFTSPADSYRKAGISLRNISEEQLSSLKKGDRNLLSY